MSLQQVDFSKVLTDDQVYDNLMANYDQLGRDWIAHQWNWMNNVYWAFNDHYKYMIVISLVEKTLQFYDQMNIQYTYDQYYSKSYLQIEKFGITELCDKLHLPKETVRRKVLELEKLGVLKRQKKKIIIDRTSFRLVKPENQIRFTARYISLYANILYKKKILTKQIDQKYIENIIKKNFSLCWRWFYRMQIPLMIGYNEMFTDHTTFHIWGTTVMNQAFNYKKKLDDNSIRTTTPDDYMQFNKNVISEQIGGSSGLSAMSISDMTNIPRATVVRKCKYLVDHQYLKVDEKKQYSLTGLNVSKILRYQSKAFRNKAKFIRKVLNLISIN